MWKKIICWVGVVVGGHVVRGILIPAIAAITAGGADGVSLFVLLLAGSLFEVRGMYSLADAFVEGDIDKLSNCAMWVTFGVILLGGVARSVG